MDVLPLDSAQLSLLEPSEIGAWPLGNPGDEVEIDGRLIVEAVRTFSPTPVMDRVDFWLDEDQEESVSS